MSDKEKDKGAQGPTPNVWLRYKYAPITVSGPVNIGMGEPIPLPTEAEQRAGFRVPPERLNEFRRTFGERYVASLADAGYPPPEKPTEEKKDGEGNDNA